LSVSLGGKKRKKEGYYSSPFLLDRDVERSLSAGKEKKELIRLRATPAKKSNSLLLFVKRGKEREKKGGRFRSSPLSLWARRKKRKMEKTYLPVPETRKKEGNKT